MLATLQRLLEIPAADLPAALTHAANAIAESLNADKVDAFLYDEPRDSLVAVGASTQPLSSLQKKLGLDVVPVSNGGRVVWVYAKGEVFRSGRLQDDAEELRGVKEGLRVRSALGVPLEIGSRRRGVLMVASLEADFFSEADEAFARSAALWVGMVAHRAELVAEIEHNALEQGRRAAADELVTVLAHDLRNYLAPITGRLYLLRHTAETNGDRQGLEHVQAACRGVARLGALISNLLDVARLDRGLFELDSEPVDLVELVRELASALGTIDHDIIVRPSEAVIVAADPGRLRQCIDNLLANAIAHSPDSAPVHVFVSEVEGEGRSWGKVEVVDEGPGIPEELRSRLFDRFATGRASEGGLGLGLYIARRIAAAHGGDLAAEVPDGRGARFVLRVPLYRDSGSAD
jgi:signal transduction histidine kinase